MTDATAADFAEAARIVRVVIAACRAGELDASPLLVRLAEGASLALSAASQLHPSETA